MTAAGVIYSYLKYMTLGEKVSVYFIMVEQFGFCPEEADLDECPSDVAFRIRMEQQHCRTLEIAPFGEIQFSMSPASGSRNTLSSSRRLCFASFRKTEIASFDISRILTCGIGAPSHVLPYFFIRKRSSAAPLSVWLVLPLR